MQEQSAANTITGDSRTDFFFLKHDFTCLFIKKKKKAESTANTTEPQRVATNQTSTAEQQQEERYGPSP
jgi:hypothetical protein